MSGWAGTCLLFRGKWGTDCLCAGTDTQEPSRSTDSEETSKEAQTAPAPQAPASPVVEPPEAQEPVQGQGGPTEDLVLMTAPEQAPGEPAALESTAEVAWVAEAGAMESDAAAADAAITNDVALATAGLVDLWSGNGEGTSALPAEPRAPTPPSGAEGTPAEVPLLNEVAQEPPPPAGDACANLLGFDALLPEPPTTFCDPEEEVEGEPLAAPQTPALPSAPEEPEPEAEPEAHLLTNGETTQKEGTQVGQRLLGGRWGRPAGCLHPSGL